MIKFSKSESAIHCIDSRVKIIFILAFPFILYLLPLEFSVLAFVVLLALYRLAGISLSETVSGNKFLAIASFVPFLFRIFFEKGSVLVFGFLLPSAAYYGPLSFLYAFSIVFLAVLFILSTSPAEIRNALLSFGLPKNLAFMLSISLQYLPILEKNVSKTRISQASRGSKKIFPLLLPLFHSVFRRAKSLSISIESRGFNPEKLK